MSTTERHDTIFLDQTDAAELVHLKPRTLEKHRLSGKGPTFIKLGRKVLYDRDDLIAWARSNRRTSTSDKGSAA